MSTPTIGFGPLKGPDLRLSTDDTGAVNSSGALRSVSTSVSSVGDVLPSFVGRRRGDFHTLTSGTDRTLYVAEGYDGKVFSDNFDRVNSSNIGRGWVGAGSSVFDIYFRRARSGGNNHCMTQPFGNTDVEVFCELDTTGAGNPGIVVYTTEGQGPLKGYVARIDYGAAAGSANVFLFKDNAQVASFATGFQFGGPVDMLVTVYGNVVTVYIAGDQMLQWTDPGTRPAGTLIGVSNGARDITNYYNDFSIDEVGTYVWVKVGSQATANKTGSWSLNDEKLFLRTGADPSYFLQYGATDGRSVLSGLSGVRLRSDTADLATFDLSQVTIHRPMVSAGSLTVGVAGGSNSDIMLNSTSRPTIYTTQGDTGLQVRSAGNGLLQFNVDNNGPIQTGTGLFEARGSLSVAGATTLNGEVLAQRTLSQTAPNYVPMVDLLNTTASAAGTASLVRTRLASGWSTTFGTIQSQWWHAFGNGNGAVAWGFDGSNLRPNGNLGLGTNAAPWGATFVGMTTIKSSNAGALKLISDGATDHIFQEFYARSGAQTQRTAWFGYGGAGTTTLSLANELVNGDINLMTVGTGRAKVNGGRIYFAGQGPALGVVGSDMAYDTIMGAAGLGVGQLGEQAVYGFNIKDGAVTYDKLSLGARAFVEVAGVQTRNGFTRYVTNPNSGQVDSAGNSIGNLFTQGATVTDGLAYNGLAQRAETTMADSAYIVYGPYYGQQKDTTKSRLQAPNQGPGLAPGHYRLTAFVRLGSLPAGDAGDAPCLALSVYDNRGTAVIENSGAETVFTPNMIGTTGYVGVSIPFRVVADTYDSTGTAGLETYVRYRNAAGVTVNVSHVVVEPYNPLSQGEVTTTYLRDASITDAKIFQVSAGKLTAGLINTDELALGPSGRLYGGESGYSRRVQFTSGGITSYVTTNLITEEYRTSESGFVDAGLTIIGAGTTIASSVDQAFSGTRSIAVTVGTSGVTNGVYYNADYDTDMVAARARQPMEPNTPYTLTVYARTNAAAARGVNVRMITYDSAGVEVESFTGATVSATNTAWTRLKVPFTTSGAAVSWGEPRFQVVAADAVAGEIFYVDAWQLEKGLVETPFTNLTDVNNYRFLLTSTGNFQLRSAATGARMLLSNSGLEFYNASNILTVDLNNNASFTLQNNTGTASVMRMTNSGLNFYNSGGVNTVSLNSTGAFMLRSAATGTRMEMDGNGLRTYVGTATVPSIDLNATTGTGKFTGEIQAGSGLIAGFTIASSGTEPNIGLFSGTGATRVHMRPGHGFWAGADARDSAKFRVTEAGLLTAIDANLTNATVTGTVQASVFRTSAVGTTRIEINNGVGADQIRFYNSNATSEVGAIRQASGTTMYFTNYGTGRMHIESNGGLLLGQLGQDTIIRGHINLGGNRTIVDLDTTGTGYTTASLEIQDTGVPRIAFHQPGAVASSIGQIDGSEHFRIYSNAGNDWRGLQAQYFQINNLGYFDGGGTYGTGRMMGVRNSWFGLAFSDQGQHLMMNRFDQGTYDSVAGVWRWRFNTSTVANGEGTLVNGYVPFDRVNGNRGSTIIIRPASTGALYLNQGTSARSGYIGFYSEPGNRQGYIGWSPTNATGDTGEIIYQAGQHTMANLTLHHKDSQASGNMALWTRTTGTHGTAGIRYQWVNGSNNISALHKIHGPNGPALECRSNDDAAWVNHNAGTHTNFSDPSYKGPLTPTAGGFLERGLAMKTYRYDFLPHPEIPPRERLGIDATSLPDLVKVPMWDVRDPDQNTVVYAVDTAAMDALLLGMVQELAARLEQVEEELATATRRPRIAKPTYDAQAWEVAPEKRGLRPKQPV